MEPRPDLSLLSRSAVAQVGSGSVLGRRALCSSRAACGWCAMGGVHGVRCSTHLLVSSVERTMRAVVQRVPSTISMAPTSELLSSMAPRPGASSSGMAPRRCVSSSDTNQRCALLVVVSSMAPPPLRRESSKLE